MWGRDEGKGVSWVVGVGWTDNDQNLDRWPVTSKTKLTEGACVVPYRGEKVRGERRVGRVTLRAGCDRVLHKETSHWSRRLC